MRGGRVIIGDLARRSREAIAAALSRARQVPALLAPKAYAVAATVAVVLLLGIAGVLVFAPAGEEAGRRSVAAGVPLPATVGRPEASVDAADTVAKATAPPGGGLTVPATTPEAFAQIAPVREVRALVEEADPSLLETTQEGLQVPRSADDDGRLPWRTYARPFDQGDPRPRIAIVVAGLGLSAAATAASIERMPGEVSLAFVPVARELATHLRSARRFGHETLAMLPLEAADFPFEDAGPTALLAEADEAANLRRLNTVLAAAPASVGVLAIGGTRFAQAEAAVRPVLRALAGRGLLLADASGGGAALLAAEAARLEVPRVVIDSVVDEAVDGEAIEARLAELEETARRNHVAVGLARPLPLSLARIRAWLDTLAEKRLVLAPVSAVVGTQVRTDSLGAGR